MSKVSGYFRQNNRGKEKRERRGSRFLGELQFSGFTMMFMISGFEYDDLHAFISIT